MSDKDNKFHIVLIDDDKSILTMGQFALETLFPDKVRVIGFTDSNKAISYVQSLEVQPGLLITDLEMMGHPNGFHVIDAAHAKFPMLKCILSTGKYHDHARIGEIEVKHDLFAYIAKPYGVTSLRDIITQAMQS